MVNTRSMARVEVDAPNTTASSIPFPSASNTAIAPAQPEPPKPLVIRLPARPRSTPAVPGALPHPKNLTAQLTATSAQDAIGAPATKNAKIKKARGQSSRRKTAPKTATESGAVSHPPKVEAEARVGQKSTARSKPRKKIVVAESDRVTRQKEKNTTTEPVPRIPTATDAAGDASTSTTPENLGAAISPAAVPVSTVAVFANNPSQRVREKINERYIGRFPLPLKMRKIYRDSTLAYHHTVGAPTLEAPGDALTSTTPENLEAAGPSATIPISTIAVFANDPSQAVQKKTAERYVGAIPLPLKMRKISRTSTPVLPPSVPKQGNSRDSEDAGTRKRVLSNAFEEQEKEMPVSQRARMDTEGSTSANAQIAPESQLVQDSKSTNTDEQAGKISRSQGIATLRKIRFWDEVEVTENEN